LLREGSPSVDGVLSIVTQSEVFMTEANLRRTRIAVAAGVATWLALAIVVTVRFGGFAAFLGVGWGGSVLVSTAVCLERVIGNLAVARRTRLAPRPELAEPQPVAA
jgi:hypothetical protein